MAAKLLFYCSKRFKWVNTDNKCDSTKIFFLVNDLANDNLICHPNLKWAGKTKPISTKIFLSKW